MLCYSSFSLLGFSPSDDDVSAHTKLSPRWLGSSRRMTRCDGRDRRLTRHDHQAPGWSMISEWCCNDMSTHTRTQCSLHSRHCGTVRLVQTQQTSSNFSRRLGMIHRLFNKLKVEIDAPRFLLKLITPMRNSSLLFLLNTMHSSVLLRFLWYRFLLSMATTNVPL